MKAVLFSIFLFIVACGDNPDSSYSDLFINKYDLLITSITNRDMVSYDTKTGEQKQITSVSRVTDTARAAVWLEETNELLVAVDGRDRVVAYNGIDGTTRDFIVDGQLNGVLRSMTRLVSGDILIIESNVIERFDSFGNRETSGWPISLTSAYQVRALSNGGFVACAGGGVDQVRVYDENGVVLFSDNGPGGHDARGCAEQSDGRIVVSWNGASDQVWRYNSDLTGGSAITLNSSITVMPSPTALEILDDDSIVIMDTSYGHAVHLDSNGNFQKTFGSYANSQELYFIR